ncbi:unnamed protein product, partial [Musa hybrid cultivar]
ISFPGINDCHLELGNPIKSLMWSNFCSFYLSGHVTIKKFMLDQLLDKMNV